MIDASAGDLWNGRNYDFHLTDHSSFTRKQLASYWQNLIDEYPIKFLEDPFHETDFGNWKNLTNNNTRCNLIGDNLYSTESDRIQDGVDNKYSHGIIIKPDQAGTVTRTFEAIKTAVEAGLIVITSHRSVSTEVTFLSQLTHSFNVPYVKFGPMQTDYSSIIRINELIRLYENQ